jgi:uncharacterized membrane protein YoaK (UPF0700 family)
MKITLPPLLSLNAGYVDTAGFLALHGLFTAHVTGNFVTLAAALMNGTSGALGKLLALPVFCVVIAATRLVAFRLARQGLPVLRIMLGLKLVLLSLAAVLAVMCAPFTNADAWPALITGMLLVSAMAIQNAAHRIHLAGAPPTTLMTGTTTQIMIDLADLLHGLVGDKWAAAKARMARMGLSVAMFAGGCAMAALLYAVVRERCFLVAPAIAVFTLWIRTGAPEPDPAY